MPLDTSEVGTKMTTIGTKIAAAGKAIQEQAKPLRLVGKSLSDNQASGSLTRVAVGVRSVRTLLELPAAAFHNVANFFRQITVPSLDVDQRAIELPVIGRIEVVTAVRLTIVRPLKDAASDLDDVVEHLNRIRTALGTVSDALDDLKGNLGTIRTNVTQTADHAETAGEALVESGTELQTLGTLLA